jgi:hypothetical protein
MLVYHMPASRTASRQSAKLLSSPPARKNHPAQTARNRQTDLLEVKAPGATKAPATERTEKRAERRAQAMVR